MNYYNPYKFLFFIPLALISGIAFYLISYGRELDSATFILFLLVLLAAITFSGYIISQENNPLKYKQDMKDELDTFVTKVIEAKKTSLSEEEVAKLRTEISNIYSTTYRRAERTMRISELLEEYLTKSDLK